MRVKVKFCGITSQEDAKKAVIAKIDALGFVFFKKSPRYVTPEQAKSIIKTIPTLITTVGVFVNEDLKTIEQCVKTCGLNAVQIHGDEDINYCSSLKDLNLKGVKIIKAVRVKTKESLSDIDKYPVDIILLDTYKSNMYGGTGESFDKKLILSAKDYKKPIIISGGLSPDNVYDVIREIQPYGIDVSSGIESSPGKKDKALIEKFMKEVRKAEQE